MFEDFVGGQDDGAAFITLADDLEEQIGTLPTNTSNSDETFSSRGLNKTLLTNAQVIATVG